jgi:hypothetical protein
VSHDISMTWALYITIGQESKGVTESRKEFKHRRDGPTLSVSLAALENEKSFEV